MRILITGSTGFLGEKLAEKLLQDGHELDLLVRSEAKADTLLENLNSYKNQINFLIGELTEEKLGLSNETRQALTGKIDAIYHTAALLSFDESIREDLFHINVNGTKNALNFAKKINVKRFIHVSTAYTLGTRETGVEELYPETQEFRNSYEETKAKAEHAVMSYKNEFDVLIMRPSIIIGDSSTGEANSTFGLYGIIRTIQILKKKAQRSKTNQKYRLLLNEDAVSNLVPVDYVVSALYLGLQHGEPETVYNITNPDPPKNKTTFEAIVKSLDFDQIELIPYEDEHLLTQEEVNMNKPIEVFKEYLNNSVTFQDRNTQNLFQENGYEPLNMDREMLERIVKGFINS
ncbi:SDR family NAD(P)-dependent oxidoreductase [Aquisalibacillus elongatus]|uniref:Nucleoside-diphosphate-sugar epimerase n=1 Tax=Aquisalibacillus elongatus TaxID=485577 RepID=A0A3N5B9Z4_9BACI|nr:SDR family NAD(P)-dependent oxidoreductase [Aquisalibacillus elongatus]RPF54233.1 nucleoside-diphosphate-sugar epimerase [Aquisalibacillus elongatus]